MSMPTSAQCWRSIRNSSSRQPPGGSDQPGAVQKLTMNDIRNMTPDQINARWDEVQIVMAGG